MKISTQIIILIVLFFQLGGIEPRIRAQSKITPIDSATALNLPFDVIHYDTEILPDFESKTLIGKVRIRFKILADKLSTIELDAKEIIVDDVSENDSTLNFQAKDGKILVRLSRPAVAGEIRALTIRYHGKATNFVRFFPDHFYAVYNTPNWLVCHFHPGDKATFDLRLTLPADWKAVANGSLVAEKSVGGNQTQYFWRQDTPVPPFVLGFAAGKFREVFGQQRNVQFRYLTRDVFSPTEIGRIFAGSPAMLDFFESKAGVAYPGKRYTQVLAAEAYGQELSNFTVMSENTGKRVIADERDNHVIVHEFAHQWWGNQVSCADWSHFWLNEAMAELMTAAYREQRFGREEYEDDIEKSRAGFLKIRNSGKDRPLAFRQPILESQAGGAIVYNKGLLTMHFLRNELGERAFWDGIKIYTQKHFGGVVTTADFQAAMEQASGKPLSVFFDQWLYRKSVLEVVVRHRLEKGTLTVEIEQRQNELLNIPLNIAVETSRSRQRRRIALTDKRQELRFPVVGEVLSVRVDDGGNLPFYVEHERPLEMLLYQLGHEPDVAGRADALRKLQAMAANSDEPIRARIKSALQECANADKSRLIRKLAQDILLTKPENNQTGNLEQELMRLQRAINEAEDKKDFAALDRLLTHDYIFTAPNGAVSDKKKLIEDLKNSETEVGQTINFDEIKTHDYGNAAVLSYLMTVKGRDKEGKTYANRYRNTVTWVKQREQWRMAAIHVSRVRD